MFQNSLEIDSRHFISIFNFLYIKINKYFVNNNIQLKRLLSNRRVTRILVMRKNTINSKSMEITNSITIISNTR